MKKNSNKKNEKISTRIQEDTQIDSVNSIVSNNNIRESNLKKTGTIFECHFEGCKKSFYNMNRLKIHTNNHVINKL